MNLLIPEISQLCTPATHTEAVHSQRVLFGVSHPRLWPLKAHGSTFGGGSRSLSLSSALWRQYPLWRLPIQEFCRPSLSPVSKRRMNKLHLVSTFSTKPIEHLPDKATDYNTPLSAVRRVVGGRAVAVGFETRQHKRNVHTRHDLHVATAEPKSTAHDVKLTNCLYTRPHRYSSWLYTRPTLITQMTLITRLTTTLI